MSGEMDKDCGGPTNNSMATNYTVNSSGKNDIGPWNLHLPFFLKLDISRPQSTLSETNAKTNL